MSKVTREREIGAVSGWVMLPTLLGLMGGSIWLFILFCMQAAEARYGRGPSPVMLVTSLVAFTLSLALFYGFFTLEPRQARILILFGNYVGTVKKDGFWWTNPFNAKPRMSLRARNLEGQRLKVNDRRGNPIEISAVVVWHVSDTAEAKFEVEDFEEYVRIQSESAVRHLASLYAYDHGEEEETTLRGHPEQVQESLAKELQERLGRAGVVVDEARLNHLAYAPEIAGAMLRRQQAEAIIAARTKIVQGAVSMVDLALKDLENNGVVHLDEERKAAMVSNLLVVLCGETEAHPVINAGTLYT